LEDIRRHNDSKEDLFQVSGNKRVIRNQLKTLNSTLYRKQNKEITPDKKHTILTIENVHSDKSSPVVNKQMSVWDQMALHDQSMYEREQEQKMQVQR
jgi:hypothetical protein